MHSRAQGAAADSQVIGVLVFSLGGSNALAMMLGMVVLMSVSRSRSRP